MLIIFIYEIYKIHEIYEISSVYNIMTEIDCTTIVLLIVLGIIIYILLTKRQNLENFQTSEEAVKTIASVYNKDNLSVTNANITNTANIKNKLSIGSTDAQTLPKWACAKLNNSKANGDNAVILGTEEDDNKDVHLINRGGNFSLGFYPGIGDAVGTHRDGSSWITSENPMILTLESKKDNIDTHIAMKTKMDEKKNVYLVNRDGNFRINLYGMPDVFGIQRDGNVWSNDAFSCKRLCIGKWTISTDEKDGNEPLVFSYDNTKKFGISKQGNLVNVNGQQWWQF